jgi:hypothetical protein
MKKLFFLALAICTPVCVTAQSATKPCTEAQNRTAEQESDHLHNWTELLRYYRLYGHCDDIDAGEGVSDSVAKILAHHWETLHQVSQLLTTDRGFRRFIIFSVNATDDMDDDRKIRASTIGDCPAGLHQFCKDLKAEADESIEEDASAHKTR